MKKRVLIAKKRGRLVGALIGGTLLGPLGALAGAVLNSKTDYYEEQSDSEAEAARALQVTKALEPISPGGAKILKGLGVIILAMFVYMWLAGPHSPFAS